MAVHSSYPELVIPAVSVAEFVTQYFGEYGDNIALIDNASGEQLTYARLDDQIRRLAKILRTFGVKKGDVVGISSHNCVQYPVVILATLTCGATLTACSPGNSKREMLHMLQISQPCVMFVDDEASATVEQLRSQLGCLKKVVAIHSGLGLDNGTTNGGTACNGHSEHDDGRTELDLELERDLAFIFYSSGTTGLPKGVAHSHKSMVSEILIFSNHFKLFKNDRCYMDRAMNHAYGIIMMLPCLRAGATLIFERKPHVERMISAVEQYQVTHIATAPPLMIRLAQRSGNEYCCSSLRRILYGGASLAPSLVSALEERYNVVVSSAYGMTECAPIAVSDTIHNSAASVGVVSANCAVKIVDVHTGLVVAPGKDGEILVKAPQVAVCYHKNAKATAEVFEDGWLRTGDLGHFDEKEMLYVVGRLKEMIKYNGTQVPPAEIEAVLLDHPGIADAAVIGIPDAEAGEIPKAFIVRKDEQLSGDDVQRYIEGELMDCKHLRGGVEFVAFIPINKNGKIDRLELKKRRESAKCMMIQ